MKKLKPNVFKVEPNEGVIKPGEEKKIAVIFYAGFLGKVDKCFYIEVFKLNCYTIQLTNIPTVILFIYLSLLMNKIFIININSTIMEFRNRNPQKYHLNGTL